MVPQLDGDKFVTIYIFYFYFTLKILIFYLFSIKSV